MTRQLWRRKDMKKDILNISIKLLLIGMSICFVLGMAICFILNKFLSSSISLILTMIIICVMGSVFTCYIFFNKRD